MRIPTKTVAVSITFFSVKSVSSNSGSGTDCKVNSCSKSSSSESTTAIGPLTREIDMMLLLISRGLRGRSCRKYTAIADMRIIKSLI